VKGADLQDAGVVAASPEVEITVIPRCEMDRTHHRRLVRRLGSRYDRDFGLAVPTLWVALWCGIAHMLSQAVGPILD